MISVVVADDHAMVREGIAGFLARETDIEVIGTAADGEATCVLVHQVQPDVVLMDISMPVMNGISATARICHARPETRVVILTSFANHAEVLGAIDAGACGYLLKDSEPEAVVRAVRNAAAGDVPLDPRIASVLIGVRRAEANVRLTDREREVVVALCDGSTNKVIARRLGIAEKTVKTHLTRIYIAIQVSGRSAAIVWARDHNLHR